MVDTAVASSNKHTNDGNSLEEELNMLLSSSSSFSVASYLNLALGSQNEVSSSSIPTQTTYSSRLSSQSSLSVVDQPDELQRRMAELALQLQIQTQSCHEGTLKDWGYNISEHYYFPGRPFYHRFFLLSKSCFRYWQDRCRLTSCSATMRR